LGDDIKMAPRGYNRPGTKIPEGVLNSSWLQGMMAGFPACYFCIKAFSETDQTEGLKKITVPTQILRGNDDQIVPIAASALLSAKLIENATSKVHMGAPHGMCTTHENQLNETFRHSSSPEERVKRKSSILESLWPQCELHKFLARSGSLRLSNDRFPSPRPERSESKWTRVASATAMRW
jgi:dienelactone hydrolase